MNDFSIQSIDDPRALIIRIGGPLDMHNHDELTRHLAQAQTKRPKLVVLDLSGATLISSICIGSIVMFRRAVVANGGVVGIARTGGMIADELRRVAIQQLFPVYDSVDAALAAGKSGKAGQ